MASSTDAGGPRGFFTAGRKNPRGLLCSGGLRCELIGIKLQVDCLKQKRYSPKGGNPSEKEKEVTAMGKAFHVKCTDCAYEETFYLGVGANDADMV